MKLIGLTLQNIGPYIHESIKFETNRSKNIVMLCGENGAGKTTFLKAIKLGLFGGYSYGVKQKSKSTAYVDEVKSIIRNNESQGTIDVTFSIVENYKEVVYRIRRGWEIEPSFKENIAVYVNHKRIDNENMVNVINYISNYYTPSIIDSIMFDGEKIISLVDNSQLSNYVKDTVINLFGLNTHYALIDDLERYINSYIKTEALSIEQISLDEKEKELKIQKNQLAKEKEKISSLKKLLDVKEYSVNENIRTYSSMGGIAPSILKDTIDQLNSLEKDREGNRLALKEFMESELIFMLNEKIIKKATQQVELEEPKRHISNLNDLLNSTVALGSEDRINLEKVRDILNGQLFTNTYINLSKDEYDKFHTYSKLIKQSKRKFNEISKNKSSNTDVIKALKEQIAISQTDAMELLYSEIEHDLVSIEDINTSLKSTENNVHEIEVTIEQLSHEIGQLKTIVFNQTKNNNSYVMAKKYQEVCNKYCDKEIERITKMISDKCTQVILDTYRKKDYITRLEVTKEFAINIYNGNELKPIQQLSAGEKQLLVAAVLSTIVKLSSKNIFVIYDTPAGRLDNEHMVNFYKNIMMDVANQVIIMPTSKEINDQVIDTVKDRVSACYTIQYDNQGYSKININYIFEREWDDGSKN